jgi:hypothetical protein
LESCLSLFGCSILSQEELLLEKIVILLLKKKYLNIIQEELQKLGMEATPRILELMPQNHGQILMMRVDVTWLHI